MIKKLLLLLLIATTCSSGAQGFLGVTGTITHRNSLKPFVGARIEVIAKDHPLLATTTNDTGGYAFKIPLFPPEVYTVAVSDSGCVTKTFIISTEGIPAGDLEDNFSDIIAYIELFKRVPGIDYSSISQPLNRYYYDRENDRITYDKGLIAVTLKNLEAIKLKEDNLMKQELILKTERLLAQRKRASIIYGLISLGVLAIIIILLVILVRKRNRKLQSEAWRESNDFKV